VLCVLCPLINRLLLQAPISGGERFGFHDLAALMHLILSRTPVTFFSDIFCRQLEHLARKHQHDPGCFDELLQALFPGYNVRLTLPLPEELAAPGPRVGFTIIEGPLPDDAAARRDYETVALSDRVTRLTTCLRQCLPAAVAGGERAVTGAVPLAHSYGHSDECRVQFASTVVTGVGHASEAAEHANSELSAVAPTLRNLHPINFLYAIGARAATRNQMLVARQPLSLLEAFLRALTRYLSAAGALAEFQENARKSGKPVATTDELVAAMEQRVAAAKAARIKKSDSVRRLLPVLQHSAVHCCLYSSLATAPVMVSLLHPHLSTACLSICS
jgi:hypothetical protein